MNGLDNNNQNKMKIHLCKLTNNLNYNIKNKYEKMFAESIDKYFFQYIINVVQTNV